VEISSKKRKNSKNDPENNDRCLKTYCLKLLSQVEMEATIEGHTTSATVSETQQLNPWRQQWFDREKAFLEAILFY
jgi:hypothetical protein